MFIVYRAFNIKTGMSYVGQTHRSLKDRIRSHYSTVRTHFGRVLKSTDESEWEWTVIDNAKKIEEAYEKECYWAAHFNCFTNGYNSPVTHVVSENLRSKLSKAAKGRTPWNKGKNKVYSEEMITRLSMAKVGKKTGPITTERREAITKAVQESVGKKVINNNTGEIYPSVMQAHRELGISHNHVKRLLSGKVKRSAINISYHP